MSNDQLACLIVAWPALTLCVIWALGHWFAVHDDMLERAHDA